MLSILYSCTCFIFIIYVYLFIYLCIYAFMHLCIYSFIHLLIYLLAIYFVSYKIGLLSILITKFNLLSV